MNTLPQINLLNYSFFESLFTNETLRVRVTCVIDYKLSAQYYDIREWFQQMNNSTNDLYNKQILEQRNNRNNYS